MENLLLLLQPSNVPDKRVKLEKKFDWKFSIKCYVLFFFIYCVTSKQKNFIDHWLHHHNYTDELCLKTFNNLNHPNRKKINYLKKSVIWNSKKNYAFHRKQTKNTPPYPLYKKKDIDFCRYDFFSRSILHHHISKKQQQQQQQQNGNFLISKKISLAEMQFRAQQW